VDKNMVQTLMLQFKDEPVPKAIQVSDWAFKRFSYLEDQILLDPKIDQYIIDADENRNWDSLSESQRDDLIDLWSQDFAKIFHK
jgi:hypothetical protein